VTAALLFAALGPDDTTGSSASRARVSEEHAALIPRIRAGDEEALGEVYHAYHPIMWDVAYRYLQDRDMAEDAVHDVFRMLWERRATFAVESTLASYLLGAVRHRALNLLRHAGVTRRAAQRFDASDIPALGAAPQPADSRVINSDLEARVLHYLTTLPERTRALVLLRWKHGLPYAEVAVALGISPEAAKKLGQRVQGVLRPLLEELKEG
jgi:RNA polymerase sigma factor (sigma-70 family)